MATAVEEFEIRPDIIVQAFDIETTLEAFSLNDIEEFYIEYGGVTDPLGQLASAVMNFIDSAVSSAVSTLKNAISSIVGSIKSAISGVESAIKSAISGLKSSILSAIGGVKSMISSVSSSLQSIGSSISNAISNAISTVTSTISSMGQSIISTVQGVANTIQSIGSSILNAISNAISTVTSTISSVSQTITSAIQNAFATIQNILSSFQDTITNFLQNISSQIQTTLTSITQSIQSISESILNTLQDISASIQNVLQNVSNQIQAVLTNLTQTLQNVTQTITNTMQNISATIQNTIQSFSQTVSQIATSITSTLQSVSQTITSGFQAFLSQIGDVLTQVQNMVQSAIQSMQSVAQSISATIQNAFASIQSFLNNLSATMVSAIQGVSQTIQSMFTPIINAIDWISQQVGKIPQLPSLIWEYIKPFVEPIIETIKDIPSKMVEISKAFQGFINPLVGIAQFFEQIRQEVYDFFGKFKDWVTIGWNNLVNFVKSIPNKIKDLADKTGLIGQSIYDHAIKPFQDWLGEQIVTPIDKYIIEPLEEVGDKVWQTIDSAVDKLAQSVSKIIEDPLGFFAEVLGFIIGGLRKIAESVWSHITDFGKWVAGKTIDAFNELYSFVVKPILTGVENIGKSVAGFVTKPFISLVSSARKVAENITDATQEPITMLINDLLKPMVTKVAMATEEYAMKLVDKLKSGKSAGELFEMLQFTGMLFGSIILSQYAFRALAYGIHSLASVFDKYNWEMVIGWRVKVKGETGFRFVPVGVGLRQAIGDSNMIEQAYPIYAGFNIGGTLRHLAKEFKQYPDEWGRATLYGIAIWLSQPMMRLANSMFRNMLPVELPSLSEVREITRRFTPTQKFQKFIETMKGVLALRGYNDEVISWLTTPMPTKGWYVIVIDRFGNERKVPISLLYELPTPSDIARMMIHDLFTVPDKPELAFQSFKTMMSMKGYYEDIAKFYYLLHYKYPSMSDLWEFSCRVVAKQTWVSETPTTEEDLGAENTYSPIQLQSKYSLTTFSSTEVANKLNEIVGKVLKHYAKWHDYAPFSWLEEWTADNLIYLDLMADIPQRIDARWMYKWQVPVPKEISDLTKNNYFDEKALFLIVTSRGMHPRWIESITIAECMNALAEERTYARTGVINAFKEGFMTLEEVNKILSHLTDVKILGKNVPVRFLDGEIKLLTLRAKFERALDILRDYFRDLLRGVTENILNFSVMMKNLKDMVTAIAKGLGLNNLVLDESYYKLYGAVAETLRKVRTVERIRYWYRYMLYRILYRFSEGFMSKDEFDKTINEIVNNAKLTDEERKVFVEIANLMYDGFYKKTIADGILHKVRRGVIDPEKAKEELLKLGLSEDLAEALIEKSSKIYTLSVSQLISYAEYVDIPEDYVKQKLKWMGVPEDEIPIILQVFKIRPIKDERAKMIRSVIDAYINGYITKELFQKNLKNLGESDREVQILTEFADFEKSQAEAKLAIDAILNRLRRGAITLDEAKKELSKYIVDKALIDAIIEKYVRTSVWTPDKLVSMGEYVPIDINKVVEKAKMFGYPEEEVKLYPAYLIARNLNEEIGRIITELVYLYVYDIIDEETLRKEIDKVRTLNGEVKKLGVEWIIIDDMEKELIVQRAKLRKMREQYRS